MTMSVPIGDEAAPFYLTGPKELTDTNAVCAHCGTSHPAGLKERTRRDRVDNTICRRFFGTERRSENHAERRQA
jgi:hypothetical protein